MIDRADTLTIVLSQMTQAVGDLAQGPALKTVHIEGKTGALGKLGKCERQRAQLVAADGRGDRHLLGPGDVAAGGLERGDGSLVLLELRLHRLQLLQLRLVIGHAAPSTPGLKRDAGKPKLLYATANGNGRLSKALPTHEVECKRPHK